MSKNVNEVIEALKNKAKENRDKNNQVDYNNQKDNEVLADAIDIISSLKTQNLKLQAQLKQEDNTISTTQFFNPSLAQDFYNMNGNSLQVNSYLAIRQMLGIVNNKTPAVLQNIPGLQNQGKNGLLNVNGSGVGLTTTRKVQGW